MNTIPRLFEHPTWETIASLSGNELAEFMMLALMSLGRDRGRDLRHLPRGARTVGGGPRPRKQRDTDGWFPSVTSLPLCASENRHAVEGGARLRLGPRRCYFCSMSDLMRLRALVLCQSAGPHIRASTCPLRSIRYVVGRAHAP